MNIVQVTADILSWVENFVEKPHPALGNWPPCPYARAARLRGTVAVYLGSDPYFDLKNLSKHGLGRREVVIYAYDPAEWGFELFHSSLEQANTDLLLSRDLIVLEDHPGDPEIVNGVCMNQGQYALAMCQSLSDLNIRAKQMADKSFYHGWPEEYLQGLFRHRQDPRS
jgi:hypothetical protein